MFLHSLIHTLHDKSEALLSELLAGPEERRTPPPNLPPVSNTGLRYPYFKDWEGNFFYNEYWYFGFHDISTGLTGMVAYGVVNPGGGALGRGVLTMALFEPGSSDAFQAIDSYHLDDFVASSQFADVRLGNDNHLLAEEIDGKVHYRLKAKSKDGSFSADLLFSPVVQSVLAQPHLPGPLNWEWDSWIWALPGAKVTGKVVHQGARYDIAQGGGYHDHSWGIWELWERIWAWAAASDPEKGIHVILGYRCGFEVSTIYLCIDNEILTYRSDQVERMEWKADPDSWEKYPFGLMSINYPTRASVTLEDTKNNVSMVIHWTVVETALLSHSPIAMFEHKATLSGVMTKDGVEHRFDDLLGHAQFVTRWLTPTPVGDSLG
jgi:hypothetical protein